jgi:hypothetical protein
MQFDVFISYSSHDKAAADATCAALEGAGIRCWIAPRDILPGSDWGVAIMDALDTCRAMVLIFSSNANSSPQIRREVERVVSKGLPVIPVRIEDSMPTKALAYFMGPVHWLDAMTPPLEQHLHRLADSLKALLPVDDPKSTSAQPNTIGATAAAPIAMDASAANAPAAGVAAPKINNLAMPALSRTRLLAMQAAVWIAVAIGVLLTIATIVFKVFGWLPVTAALTVASYWLVQRNLTSQIPIAKVTALACGLFWAYLAIWNAATPDISLVVIEGTAAGCLLYVAVELARVKQL